jgi:hypothetical protein
MSPGAEPIEALLSRAEALVDPEARELCRELVREVLNLHRAGLERMLAWIGGGGDAREAALRDELVRALLLLHDLDVGPEPVPLPRRATQGLIPAQSLVRRGRDAPGERCALCAGPLGTEHPHLFEVATRRLVCACEACGVLLSNRADARYRRVLRRSTRLVGFRMSDSAWSALGVPVDLAFFSMASIRDEVIAAYPGPAGAIEAVVERQAWDAVAADNPVLRELEPDVEALLVRRGPGAADYLRVSIDACYELTGLIRSRWQGISGGDELARAVRDFVRSLGDGASGEASSSRLAD